MYSLAKEHAVPSGKSKDRKPDPGGGIGQRGMDMNKKLVQEREDLVSLERWEILWTAGSRGGTCRLELVLEVNPVRGDRKYVWLERRTGNRPPMELFGFIVRETVGRRLPIPEEEPIERILSLTGNYRIQLRRSPRRSIRMDEKGGVRDFLLSVDELSRLMYWFEYRKPIHANGEDVAFYAI